MKTGGKAPDVVTRAAARLGDSLAPKATDTAMTAAAEGPFTTPSPAPRAQAPARQSRTVNVSPTSLAANGISLPSAGTQRTVEEFRVIKRHVLANAEAGTSGQLNRTVMVTSSRPGDGKTYTAINLALSIAAERELRVLLVDADVYRQGMLRHLGIEANLGWVDYLSGDDISFSDILLHTNIANFSVLPAGKAHAEVPELMSSTKMSQFVMDLAQRYTDRFIVFDTLPCLASSEPAILARMVGQTVFVVAAHETSRDQVESSLRLVSGCPRVSLMLNKAQPALTEQFGSYGYAYKYRQSGA